MEKTPESNKNYKILLQDKVGSYALEPFSSKDNKIFTIDKCTSLKSVKKYIAVLNAGKLTLYSSKDFSLIKS
ncbi:MAG: hypothetical protein MJ252_20420, partial [archaeon]|nr:hypothetical protein [archaeon]